MHVQRDVVAVDAAKTFIDYKIGASSAYFILSLLKLYAF